MHYYEDPVKGSIYSREELERMFRGQPIMLAQVLQMLKPVPAGTCSVLEEAEAIAARAESGWLRSWVDRWKRQA